MTATAQRPHVQCSEYCSKLIYDADRDHDPECGAPLAYRKHLKDVLKGLKFEAAAASGETIETPVEVDAKPAVARRRPAPEPEREKPQWRDPIVEESWVFGAQQRIDEKGIKVGGMGEGKKCSGRGVVDGVELDCPHLAVIKSVETYECAYKDGEKHSKHTNAVDQWCLIHGIRYLAEGLSPVGNGPLLAGLE